MKKYFIEYYDLLIQLFGNPKVITLNDKPTVKADDVDVDNHSEVNSQPKTTLKNQVENEKKTISSDEASETSNRQRSFFNRMLDKFMDVLLPEDLD